MTVSLWEDCDFKKSVNVCDFRRIPFLIKSFSNNSIWKKCKFHNVYRIFVYYKIRSYKLHIINFWCYLSINFYFFYFWNNLEYIVIHWKTHFCCYQIPVAIIVFLSATNFVTENTVSIFLVTIFTYLLSLNWKLIK